MSPKLQPSTCLNLAPTYNRPVLLKHPPSEIRNCVTRWWQLSVSLRQSVFLTEYLKFQHKTEKQQIPVKPIFKTALSRGWEKSFPNEKCWQNFVVYVFIRIIVTQVPMTLDQHGGWGADPRHNRRSKCNC